MVDEKVKKRKQMYERYRVYDMNGLWFKSASDVDLQDWIKADTADRVAKNMSAYWPQTPRRVIAIGDLHGDWESTRGVLQQAGLINREMEWTGGDTMVVQCGDLLDRGGRGMDPSLPSYWTDEGSELRMIAYFAWLDDQASMQGGRVLNVFGNHEFMNFKGNFSYATPNSIGSFVTREHLRKSGNKVSQIPNQVKHHNRELALRIDMNGWLTHWFARNRYWMVQIGTWVFVHGGLFSDAKSWQHVLRRQELLEQFSTMTMEERVAWTTILRKYLLNEPLTEIQMAQLETIEEGILWDRSVGISYGNRIQQELYQRGIQMNMTQIGEPQPAVQQIQQKVEREMVAQCQKLKDTLQYFQANHLVVAHTPQREIHSDCDGAVWRVDMMMSRAFAPRGGRKVGFLEITWDAEHPNGQPKAKMFRKLQPASMLHYFHTTSPQKRSSRNHNHNRNHGNTESESKQIRTE